MALGRALRTLLAALGLLHSCIGLFYAAQLIRVLQGVSVFWLDELDRLSMDIYAPHLQKLKSIDTPVQCKTF